MGRLSRRAAGAAALFAALLIVRAPARAATLRNGGFSEGSGGVPADWRSEAWARETVQFTWGAEGGAGHSIGIINQQPNDARWCQTITVVPGATYRVSTRARTSDIGMGNSGAHIAIEPRVGDSDDLRGTQDWQPLELSARVEENVTEWDVCLRLGSYANLNTGTAWFADVAVAQVGAPPVRPTSRRFTAWWRSWWAPARGASWGEIAVPLIGGALLAWGLGVWSRRRFRAYED